MCCLKTAWFGGMFSSILPLGAKSCFLASFISIMSLVRSFISTTNLSSRDIGFSLASEDMHSSSVNASVTSGNTLHVAHAVFFPLPEKVAPCHILLRRGRWEDWSSTLDPLWPSAHGYLCIDDVIQCKG